MLATGEATIQVVVSHSVEEKGQRAVGICNQMSPNLLLQILPQSAPLEHHFEDALHLKNESCLQ